MGRFRRIWCKRPVSEMSGVGVLCSSPQREYGFPLHDVEGALPGVYTEEETIRRYTSEHPADRRVWTLIQAARGKPDMGVKVYKAVPVTVTKRASIRPGDWVCLDRGHAMDYWNAIHSDNCRITVKTVSARDLYCAGYVQEWGYDPS